MPSPATTAATDKITAALATASEAHTIVSQSLVTASQALTTANQAALAAIAGLRELGAAHHDTDDRLAQLERRLEAVEGFLARRQSDTE
jgi:hypothetical protein